jgi:hypothetical protein
MLDEKKLIEKLVKIQVLYENAGTDGEKTAALAAIQRLTLQLKEVESSPVVEEFKFTFDNPWSRNLFIALLRKHKISPYRKSRQKKTTVMAKMTGEFCDMLLWPEFMALNEEMSAYLNQAADKIIRQAVSSDISEPAES